MTSSEQLPEIVITKVNGHDTSEYCSLGSLICENSPEVFFANAENKENKLLKDESDVSHSQLIFSPKHNRSMDQDFHTEHLQCFGCESSLTGQRYVLRDEHPYCIKCYETNFASACDKCQQIIGIDSKDLSYKEKHWHENCFLCTECGGSLVDQPFAQKHEKIYCADCHDELFAARCDDCKKPFRAGMKKFEYKGRQWHETCFLCIVCKEPIGNKSFIPKDDDMVCVPCFEEKFASRCNSCSGVIKTGGVTYKSAPFHRECFKCTNCEKLLAGEKFTSKEEKPYCADCYGELFSKKCLKCEKPITGFGGTKFIAFEEKQWHSDCFTCSKCDATLVGKGFLMEENNVVCPDCGRA